MNLSPPNQFQVFQAVRKCAPPPRKFVLPHRGGDAPPPDEKGLNLKISRPIAGGTLRKSP